MSEIVRFTADYSDEHPAGEYVEYSEYEQLKQHELELMAQVERLKWALNEYGIDDEEVNVFLSESPPQSLAEHDAEVVEKYGKHVCWASQNNEYVMSPEEYANQLRLQADKE